MNYRDFFDDKEKDIPFGAGLESTYAYLRWYDMFLQAAMEQKEGVKGGLLAEDLKKAAAILGSRVAASEGSEVSGFDGLSIVNVAAEFGLYDYSFFCLLMAIAQDFDTNYLKGYAELSGDSGVKAPSFALSQEVYSVIADGEQLLDMGRVRSIIDHCPLFDITPSKKGQGSLTDTFEANRQLIALLKGDYLFPRTLSQLCDELAGTSDSDNLFHKDKVKELRKYLSFTGDTKGTIISLSGSPKSGRIDLIRAAIGEGRAALTLDIALLTSLESSQVREIIDDALVRTRLLGEELIIIADGEDNSTVLSLLMRRCLEVLDRVFVLTSEAAPYGALLAGDETCQYRYFNIKMELPTAAEQLDIWTKELKAVKTAKDVKPEEFAGIYRLQPQVITDCVSLARDTALSKGQKSITKEDLTDSVLANTTGALDALSHRMPLTFTWDDMIVDPRQRKIMDTLVSRVRNRSLVDETWGFKAKVPYGRGVSMILYGPPGTGKTMAAQVMAKEIGMALYRVDLSQMVDKYIGETEKNIGKIFDAASDGNVILFFDEADALFSKRTEVSTSNDKHANTEVAYLLQKIEQHDGVTFLATNRFKDFDQAFVRRITYAVHLERPDKDRRLELFEKILPDKTPRDKDLDLEFFAENFDLSGSEIKEVLYSAAFIAAMDGKSLSNKHLSEAIKYQQEKSGKVFEGAAFGKYFI